MADYLSRHPSESNSNNNKIKAEELWHNWFTVNEKTKVNFASANQQLQNIAKQPIREQAKGACELAKASDVTSASEQHESVNESSCLEQRKTNKQSIQQIASIVKAQSQTSESEQDADIAMNRELIDAANQSTIKSPICYSVNQIEVLQQLGFHSFAAHYESDEFMQTIIGLLKQPDTTKFS